MADPYITSIHHYESPLKLILFKPFRLLFFPCDLPRSPWWLLAGGALSSGLMHEVPGLGVRVQGVGFRVSWVVRAVLHHSVQAQRSNLDGMILHQTTVDFEGDCTSQLEPGCASMRSLSF